MNRVAIDIDEVLVPFVKPMAEWRGYRMPRTYSYPYVYRDMFNITEKQSQRMVQDFYKSPEFANLEPIPRAHETMKKIRKKTQKIYAVTGRQDSARRVTEEWLEKYFPDIFDDLVLTNSYTDIEIPKLSVCHALDLDTIIDDNEHTCRECIMGGMTAIHFGGYDKIMYPWCNCIETSVFDWDEVI